MDKAHALALMNALEQRKLGADARLRFDAAGAETWAVQLDPDTVYEGADLAALAAYCAQNGLTMSAVFSTLGIV